MRLLQRDPEFASVNRRLGAGCIDVACVLAAMAGVAAGALVWGTGGDAWSSVEAIFERWSAFTDTALWRRTGPVVSVVSTVALRNSRGPGMRAMHIRRVDAHTGGPVTARSALTSQLLVQGRARLVRRMGAPKRERQQARVRAMQPDIEAARREHPDDAQAQQQAVTAVYRAKGVSPFGGCSSAMFISAVINAVAVLATPRHQSPEDWIAGIVTVRD